MTRFKPMLLVLLAPLLLAGCLVTPGKFTSTLDIRADRSFTFTYTGEVVALDLEKQFAKGMAKGMVEGMDADDANKGNDDAGSGDNDAKMRAVAEALRKEAGYRSVEYRGDGVFDIDYTISGTLNHGFVFPFNTDAEIVLPFLAVELRGKDRLRVKAPGFANGRSEKRIPGGGKAASRLDGTFKLTTAAAVISQNSENGKVVDHAETAITWQVDPLTKDAPAAVLQVAPMP